MPVAEYVVENPVKPRKDEQVEAVSCDLQSLQRHRAIVIKSRIMQANRMQAIVAGTLGYSSSMAEKDRVKKFTEASAHIKAILAGETDCAIAPIVRTTAIGIEAFDNQQAVIEKQMLTFAKRLPVAEWVDQPEQRGFGLLSLAVIVGECGDLSNYANPGKVWRRMGCAPFEYDGKTLMGATWRTGKQGKLPSECWESFGYSPRRRSIMYVVTESLMKGNKDIYRQRYDDAKASLQSLHPDYSPLRCHRHGMLLMGKLLLKNLWIRWNS